jgi:DamX protein
MQSLFGSSSIRKIYRSSGGLSGRINIMANQQLNEKSSKRARRRDSADSRRSNRSIFVWAAAALIITLIVICGIYYYPRLSGYDSDSQKFVQTVFRGKIDVAEQLPSKPPLLADSKTSQENIPQNSPKNVDADITETNQTATNLSPPDKSITAETSPKKPAETEAAPENNVKDDIASEENIQNYAMPEIPVELETKPEKSVDVAKASESPRAPEPAVESQAPAAEATDERQILYREDWLLSQRSTDFTIQIMGVRNEKRIFDFIDRNQALNRAGIAYYKTSYKGKDWYPLLFGVYPTKDEANSAIRKLPPDLQKASPWIRKMSSIQRAIRKHANP